MFRLRTELLIIILLLVFAVLYIETTSSTSALNEAVFVVGNVTNTVSNQGTHLKMHNMSNITTSPIQQIFHKDTLSRSNKDGKATNDSTPQDFLILEKLVNETNHSIDKLASVDFLIGFFAIIFGGLGVLLAIAVPYLYEKWKQPHLEILIPENDPPGKNRRYLHAFVINTPHKYLPIERNAAIDTNVELRFYDAHGTPLFGDKPIVAKWSNKPRCLTLGQFDDTKVPDAHRQNVLPGSRGEPFDVVIKNVGSENCYGFNGWSYEFTPTEENKLFEIPNGTFEVRIKAVSGIHGSHEVEFLLVNKGPNLEDISLSIKD